MHIHVIHAGAPANLMHSRALTVGANVVSKLSTFSRSGAADLSAPYYTVIHLKWNRKQDDRQTVERDVGASGGGRATRQR